jgi:GNAT superfamily N-acetyltransferase
MKTRVVQSTDPLNAELQAAGYVVVAESWGARLRIGEGFDLDTLHSAISRLTASGLRVQELDASFAADLVALETANEPDYPSTPATRHQAPTAAEASRLWADGARVFGAFDDAALVGVTVIRRRPDRAETEFTSVAQTYRGRGVAVALKALSILTMAEEGFEVFGTGGAQVNEASRRMNEALGYVIEERWLSYQLPSGLDSAG